MSVFDEFKYLIKAPSKLWLDSLATKGYLYLESVKFLIVAWEREFGEGLPLDVIWVRVYGFPLVMNEWLEIERIFNPFGAFLLQIDTATDNGYDVHFLRLKMEVCDRNCISKQHLVLLRRVDGRRSMYDLEIEIETPQIENLNTWARRKEGRPYPNGTEFGQKQRTDNSGGPAGTGSNGPNLFGTGHIGALDTFQPNGTQPAAGRQHTTDSGVGGTGSTN